MSFFRTIGHFEEAKSPMPQNSILRLVRTASLLAAAFITCLAPAQVMQGEPLTKPASALAAEQMQTLEVVPVAEMPPLDMKTIEEEDAVCVLQILLAGELPGVGRDRALADMDAWGYSFRLGSARAYFECDAESAWAWLERHGLADGASRMPVLPPRPAAAA